MGSNNEQSFFCLLAVSNDTLLVIDLVLTALSVPLAGLAFRKFCRMGGSHNSSTNFVYTMLLLWWLAFLLSNVYSMVLFKLNDDDPQEYDSVKMSHLSRYSFVGDWVCTFIIQLLLLYVPYRWCKNITVLFNGGPQRSPSTRGSEIFDVEQYHGVETKIYPFLKVYTLLRVLELGLPVAFLGLEEQTGLIFDIMIYCLLADCLIVSFSLLLGMLSLKTSEYLQESLDEDESKRMFNQYLFISAASLIRFAFIVMGIILTIFGGGPFSETCPGKGESGVFEIVFMLAIGFFGDFFPIIIILRIYTLEEKPEEICKSLIITTTGADASSSIRLKE